MELKELLGGSFACECGKRHEVPVRHFLYEAGATNAVPEILAECTAAGGERRVVVVADCRTWEICGREVHKVVRGQGFAAKEVILPDRDGYGPVCDELTCKSLQEAIRNYSAKAVVAVGSGVINDLCKWSSFELGLCYMVVATAASMNGYAAANVAAKLGGVKVVLRAQPPVAVVAEPSVIERAPAEMTAAGFGDTIAKPYSNADWLMNEILFGEYYCRWCAGLLAGLERLYLQDPQALARGQRAAVRGLFEALFWTGVVMTMVGSSVPASGAEHLLSHTLDMAAEIHGRSSDLHGRQVGLGSVFAAALWDQVLGVEQVETVEMPKQIDRMFWGSSRLADAVAEQYLAKKRAYRIMQERLMQPGLWDRLREQLHGEVRSAGQTKELLRRAGAANTIGDIGCSRQQIREAAMHMHEIRARCTVVDLAWMLGILPEAVDDIIEQWLLR